MFLCVLLVTGLNIIFFYLKNSQNFFSHQSRGWGFWMSSVWFIFAHRFFTEVVLCPLSELFWNSIFLHNFAVELLCLCLSLKVLLFISKHVWSLPVLDVATCTFLSAKLYYFMLCRIKEAKASQFPSKLQKHLSFSLTENLCTLLTLTNKSIHLHFWVEWIIINSLTKHNIAV